MIAINWTVPQFWIYIFIMFLNYISLHVCSLIVSSVIIAWVDFLIQTFNSRIHLVGMSLKAFGSPGGKASNVKVVLNGGEHVTFLRPDGYFSLYPTNYIFSCSFLVHSVKNSFVLFILPISSSSSFFFNTFLRVDCLFPNYFMEDGKRSFHFLIP